jgi:hypothetical protein
MKKNGGAAGARGAAAGAHGPAAGTHSAAATPVRRRARAALRPCRVAPARRRARTTPARRRARAAPPALFEYMIAGQHKASGCQGESGWRADWTSTPGAWRHAGV